MDLTGLGVDCLREIGSFDNDGPIAYSKSNPLHKVLGLSEVHTKVRRELDFSDCPMLK